MADFECRQLEIGLELVRCSFGERNNFSEGSSEPKKDAQVIRVRGAAAPRVFLTRITCLLCDMPAAKTWYIDVIGGSLKLMNTGGEEVKRARGKMYGAIRDTRPGSNYAKEGTTTEQKLSLIMVQCHNRRYSRRYKQI